MHHRLLGLLALVSSLSAQTFVVDAAGGPGANFTSIAAAVAAVPDGAVLVVRPGDYGSFAITAKSLTILGEPDARLVGSSVVGASVSISGLAAGQRVVVRGLDSVSHFQAMGGVSCQNCSGSILLDGLRWGFGSGAFRLDVDQCAQVQVGDCEFRGTNATHGARVVASDVHFLRTHLQGGTPAGLPAVGRPGLEQVGGRVQVVASTVVGGAGLFAAGGSAVSMLGGDLRVVGSTVLQPGSGAPNGLAIAGAGVARVDPAIALSQVAPGVAWTATAMPHLTSAGGALSLTASATLGGSAGDLGLIALGVPDAPVFVPGWSDPLWLANPFLMDVAVLGAPFVFSVGVPFDPTLEGLCFAWQGFSLDANFLLQVSNPAWFVVYQ